jgi:hypothetical protein
MSGGRTLIIVMGWCDLGMCEGSARILEVLSLFDTAHMHKLAFWRQIECVGIWILLLVCRSRSLEFKYKFRTSIWFSGFICVDYINIVLVAMSRDYTNFKLAGLLILYSFHDLLRSQGMIRPHKGFIGHSVVYFWGQIGHNGHILDTLGAKNIRENSSDVNFPHSSPFHYDQFVPSCRALCPSFSAFVIHSIIIMYTSHFMVQSWISLHMRLIIIYVVVASHFFV